MLKKLIALELCMNGSLVSCASLGEDTFIKFSEGRFIYCNSEGTPASFVTTLPYDVDGWLELEVVEEVVFAKHYNTTSGTIFESIVGLPKFNQREANPDLVLIQEAS